MSFRPPGLYSGFKDSMNYTVRLCLKENKSVIQKKSPPLNSEHQVPCPRAETSDQEQGSREQKKIRLAWLTTQALLQLLTQAFVVGN